MSAHRWGLVTDSQKTNLFRYMRPNGWRTNEPGEVPIEKPFVLREVLRIHRDEHGFSEEDLERTALVPRRVLADLLPDYFTADPRPLRVV